MSLPSVMLTAWRFCYTCWPQQLCLPCWPTKLPRWVIKYVFLLNIYWQSVLVKNIGLMYKSVAVFNEIEFHLSSINKIHDLITISLLFIIACQGSVSFLFHVQRNLVTWKWRIRKASFQARLIIKGDYSKIVQQKMEEMVIWWNKIRNIGYIWNNLPIEPLNSWLC